MQQSSDLTTGDIGEHIKKMALPAAIGLFFQAMYNATDAYYVGQLSVTALAAVSISFPIYFLILAMGSGLGTATNALTSKARGEKNFEKAKNLAMQSILFAIFLSVLASIVGLATADVVFSAIGAKGDTHLLALEYMNMIYYGLFFFFLVMVLNGLLNSIGDTKAFGYVLVFGFFLNIILDPLFMYGGFGFPAMGVAGVALATVVTQIISTIALGYKVVKNNLLFFSFKPDLALWTKLATQSIPVTFQHSSVALGFLIIIKFVSDFGDNAIAVFGIGTRIDQLLILPAIGIATAVVPLVGQNYGAKKFGRILDIYQKSIRYSMIFLVLAIIPVMLFAENLAAIFTTNTQITRMTAEYLRITALAYVSTAIAIISSSVLQGLIKAHLSLIFTLLRFFVIGIPAVMLFAYFLGLREMGIWLAILISSLIVALFGYWYVLKTIRKLGPSL